MHRSIMFRIDSSSSPWWFVKLTFILRYWKPLTNVVRTNCIVCLSALDVRIIPRKNEIIGDVDRSAVQARILERDKDKMSSLAVLYVVQPEQAILSSFYKLVQSHKLWMWESILSRIVFKRALSQKHSKNRVIIDHRSSEFKPRGYS